MMRFQPPTSAHLVTLLLLSSSSTLMGATFRVDRTGGADTPGCGSAAAPCASIQAAVDQTAASGDLVLVAEGTYIDDQLCLFERATVCVVHKDVTILGGFGKGDWLTPDPAGNLTVISGDSKRRGVIAQKGSPDAPFTRLRMEGFTIRDGRGLLEPTEDPNGPFYGGEFGGGLRGTFADLILRDLVFEDNLAQGPPTKQGGGGGLAALATTSNIQHVTMERIVFRNNQAIGGGATLGGTGVGGALCIDHAILDKATDLTFTNNVARGGDGADGLGGAVSFFFGATGKMSRFTMSGNTAQGGARRPGYGGGLYAEGSPGQANNETKIVLEDGRIENNLVRGGSPKGGSGGGGALGFKASLALDRVQVIGNRSEGDATGAGGAGSAGIFFWSPETGTEPVFSIKNSVIAKNVSVGDSGGGSGISLLGASATVTHTTFAENRFTGPLFGSAVLINSAPPNKAGNLTMDYSIIASHPDGSAMWVFEGNPSSPTATLTRTLFAGNADDICDPGSPLCAPVAENNNIHQKGAATFFVNPATGDFHVNGASPPTDEATGSNELLDLDGAQRSGSRDIGADEFGAAAFRLSVKKIGLATGAVTSSPAGITCGADCSEVFPSGQVVDLSASPDPPFGFVGFTGHPDCADGQVTMDADKHCDATFADVPPATLVVRKVTSPAAQPVVFQFSGAVTANLGDGQSTTRTGLAPGRYTVTEAPNSDFTLASIICNDANSSGDTGTRRATFLLEASETVTCTFTNRRNGCSAAQETLPVANETVGDTRTIQACSTITAGPAYEISPSGRVTFEALQLIFTNGVAVAGEMTFVQKVP